MRSLVYLALLAVAFQLVPKDPPKPKHHEVASNRVAAVTAVTAQPMAAVPLHPPAIYANATGTTRAATQWFHPAGHTCPAWEYAPSTREAAATARVSCQRYSLRWFGGARCVQKRGFSIPSC